MYKMADGRVFFILEQYYHYTHTLSQELYECEHCRAEKLNNRLQKAKEEAIESETRLR